MRDLVPNEVESFNARQREFRDNIDAARRQRESLEDKTTTAFPGPDMPAHTPVPDPREIKDDPPLAADLASAPPPASTAATTPRVTSHLPPGLDAASSNLDPSALDSLSSHRVIEAHKPQPAAKPQKRGPLSSLIYGTKEGQQLDRDLERSFSQVLARGKYVHSIVFHDVKPDKVHEYTQLVGEWYPKMAALEKNRVHLVGSWRTQVGDNDTFGKYTHTHTYISSVKSFLLLTGVCCLLQCISGNTMGIQGTMSPYTQSGNIPTSPPSTAS